MNKLSLEFDHIHLFVISILFHTFNLYRWLLDSDLSSLRGVS